MATTSTSQGRSSGCRIVAILVLLILLVLLYLWWRNRQPAPEPDPVEPSPNSHSSWVGLFRERLVRVTGQLGECAGIAFNELMAKSRKIADVEVVAQRIRLGEG